MKNEDTKRVLEDLRRQIESLNFYLSGLKVIEDRKAKQNLYHAQQTTKDIEYKIGKNIRNIDSEIHESKAAEIDESVRISLGSINSPTDSMIKAKDFNMNIKKSGLNRSNILKEASENFIKMIKTAKEEINEKRTGSKDSK